MKSEKSENFRIDENPKSNQKMEERMRNLAEDIELLEVRLRECVEERERWESKQWEVREGKRHLDEVPGIMATIVRHKFMENQISNVLRGYDKEVDELIKLTRKRKKKRVRTKF